ncbi:MAG: DUF4288 domain-containing protein [Flammeovirgaceae bacterium]
MNWYLAKIVYQIISGSGNHTPQFDEQLRLIRADEWSWAREKANIIGRLLEQCIENNKKEKLTWKFVEVTELILLTSLEDGDEIYSTTQEPNDVNEYLTSISRKAHIYQCKNIG